MAQSCLQTGIGMFAILVVFVYVPIALINIEDLMALVTNVVSADGVKCDINKGM